MNTSTPIIEARDLTVGYGSYVVQKDLNFTINRQDVFIIMGPSGCGKSTLLRVLVGLLQPTKGQVLYRGQDFWAGTESERQKLLSGVGLLFQNYALWPNMTVYKNISFGLTNIKDELPRIDFEAKKAAQLIEVLKRPDETVRIIKECIDKKGKLDVNKAQRHIRGGIATRKKYKGT